MEPLQMGVWRWGGSDVDTCITVVSLPDGYESRDFTAHHGTLKRLRLLPEPTSIWILRAPVSGGFSTCSVCQTYHDGSVLGKLKKGRGRISIKHGAEAVMWRCFVSRGSFGCQRTFVV
jgi:hypothetical protein